MKDFDRWNSVKKRINIGDRSKVKLGEVFWCNLGINVGVEQDGNEKSFHRPIIIIKKFSNQIILAAPLTRQRHVGDWYLNINILGIEQQIILNQIKPLDIKRLTKSIGEVSKNEIKRIICAYTRLINDE